MEVGKGKEGMGRETGAKGRGGQQTGTRISITASLGLPWGGGACCQPWCGGVATCKGEGEETWPDGEEGGSQKRPNRGNCGRTKRRSGVSLKCSPGE